MSSSAAAAESLRICLVAGAPPAGQQSDEVLAAFKRYLEKTPGVDATPALAQLGSCDAALVYGGVDRFGADDAGRLREFLAAGRGLVMVRPSTERWPAWPEFDRDVLGAKSAGMFANGYPMHVINFFPHAIYAGVARLDTRQPVPLYADLAADAAMVMEGTVGETTAPLAWLRRLGASRVGVMLLGEPALFHDNDYLRLLGNVLLWTARRPIPGARAQVQRTYLSEAYPGAIAVALPGGPSFCLDPVRGGISQVWDGDFIDLRPRWITKHGEPGRFSGEEFFRDAGRASFWRGADGGDLEFHFKGYGVAGEFPEFHYLVGDREVTEETRPLPSGLGVQRRFRIGPGNTALWYKIDPQSGSEVVATGIQRDDRGLAFATKSGGEFTIEIRRKSIVGP